MLFHRGICLMALQRWQEAVDSLDRVLAGMPQHAPTLAKRGDALVAMRRFEEALASFSRALSAAPGDVGLLNNRARVLMELSRPQEALAVYEQVLQTRPGDADAWYNAGNGLAGSSRFEEALGRYDRALAIAPAHVLALSNRGNALRRLGRLDEALASYDRALAIRPDLVDTLHNRGNVLAALGRTAEARASYERVLDLEPRYLPARWALVMGAIPVAAGSKAEIDEGRRVFAAGLDELAWLAPDGLQGARAVQQMVPFYLAYHEENNRDLFARYGAICAQATEEPRRTQPRGRPVRPRVRLAVVSAHVRRIRCGTRCSRAPSSTSMRDGSTSRCFISAPSAMRRRTGRARDRATSSRDRSRPNCGPSGYGRASRTWCSTRKSGWTRRRHTSRASGWGRCRRRPGATRTRRACRPWTASSQPPRSSHRTAMSTTPSG